MKTPSKVSNQKKEPTPNRVNKHLVGRRPVQTVRIIEASELESEAMKRALGRLLAELVRQERARRSKS